MADALRDHGGHDAGGEMISCQKRLDELEARVSRLEGEPVKPPVTPPIQSPNLPSEANTEAMTEQERINHLMGWDKPAAPVPPSTTNVGQVASGDPGQLDPHSLSEDDWQFYVRHPEVWGKVATSTYTAQQINNHQAGSGTLYNPDWKESNYNGVLKR